MRIDRSAQVLLLVSAAGCAPVTASPSELSLSPGIDLFDISPIDLADGSGSPQASADAPLDLRAARIAVPEVPVGATASFDVDGTHRGWVTRLPHGMAIPTAAYGDRRVYVGSGFSSRSFYALDAETGHVEWATHDLADDGPTAPLFDDGRVVFNTESCTLFVLDAKTGRRLWTKWLGDPTLSQPAAAAGLIFAAYPADAGTRLGAFAAANGKTVWSRAIDGELISAPAVAGDSIYAATIRGTTYRFLRADGRLAWAKRGRASSAPWVFKDEVFESRVAAGGRREEQIALRAGDGELLGVLGAVDARYVWDVPRTLEDWGKVWAFDGSRPVLAGGRRFDTMGGEIRAGDPRSSSILWTRKSLGTRGTRGLTSPAVAASKVIFASHDGDLYVLDVDTGVTVFAFRLGVPIEAQPIVAKGWIYLTTRTGSVIGLSLSDATFDGWHMWGGGPSRNG